jgi:hypothetical protein
MGRERSETGVPRGVARVGRRVGWMGRYYVISSTPTPSVPNNLGNISVFTSDPRAEVNLRISPARNKAQETLPGFQWVEFTIFVYAKNGPVSWALALGLDAAPPPGELPESGVVPMPSDKHDSAGRYAVPVVGRISSMIFITRRKSTRLPPS